MDPETSILIVDESRAVSIALSFMLALRGYETVRSVRSAKRAAVVAKQYLPGIVFLHLELPDTDTLELARSMRRSIHPHRLRLIALTAIAEHPWREEAREAGFERYLVKPCQQAELDKILRMPVSSP